MASKPETTFRKKVRADLHALVAKGLPLYFDAIQQKAIKGSPDFYMCVNGLFVALELKDMNGKLSPIQDAKLHNISKADGMSLVVDQQMWPEALELIESMLGGNNDDL